MAEQSQKAEDAKAEATKPQARLLAVIDIGRHGEKEGDHITNKAVSEVYGSTRKGLESYLGDTQFPAEATFAYHTEKPRTRETVYAGLAGALRLEDPKDLKGLEALASDGLKKADVRVHPALVLGDIKFNETTGDDEETYLKKWAANPDSNEYEGKPVTPFREVFERGKAVLADAVRRVVREHKPYAQIIAHMATVEPILMAAISTASDKPVMNYQEVGGFFKMGEKAQLIIAETQDGMLVGQLRRGDKTYQVNLTRLLAETLDMTQAVYKPEEKKA